MNTSINLKRFITLIYKLLRFFSHRRDGLRVLTYHSVEKNYTGDELWTIDEVNFENQISFLKENYKVIEPNDIGSTNGSTVIVTFDDGLKQVNQNVRLIMEKYKTPFTVFIITDRINKEGYLTSEQLKDLDSCPFVTIGSHSKTHAHLDKCNLIQLESEIRESKEVLENMLGHKIDLFSYPHGRSNQVVRDAVKKFGYSMAFGSRFDRNLPSQDHYDLNRNEIWVYDGLADLKSKLEGNWDWLRYREYLK